MPPRKHHHAAEANAAATAAAAAAALARCASVIPDVQQTRDDWLRQRERVRRECLALLKACTAVVEFTHAFQPPSELTEEERAALHTVVTFIEQHAERILLSARLAFSRRRTRTATQPR